MDAGITVVEGVSRRPDPGALSYALTAEPLPQLLPPPGGRVGRVDL